MIFILLVVSGSSLPYKALEILCWSEFLSCVNFLVCCKAVELESSRAWGTRPHVIKGAPQVRGFNFLYLHDSYIASIFIKSYLLVCWIWRWKLMLQSLSQHHHVVYQLILRLYRFLYVWHCFIFQIVFKYILLRGVILHTWLLRCSL